MRDLRAFLNASVVASSVFAAFSVTAVADTVPPFAGIAPFPGSGSPYYLSSTLTTAFKPANGQTYALNCNTTYAGPIDVSGTTNVTIQPGATCASGQNPVIFPGAPINGAWSVYDSVHNIYVTNVNFQVAQVFANSQLVGIAHYPDSILESGWLQLSALTDVHTYDSTASMTISYPGLPSDLVGAQITYRGSYPWSIGTRNISSYNTSTGSMVLDPISDANLRAEDASNIGRFYLEGKLWMLAKMNASSSGWAFVGGATGGKLYLKLATGQTASSLNIWGAAPVKRVIDARGSTGLVIKNVRIVGGEIGIDASPLDNSTGSHLTSGLQVLNSEISYSNWSAISASYSSNMKVDRSTISGALHSGIYARVGTSTTTVTNSTFNYVNNIGMHKGGDAAVYVSWDSGPNVNANLFYYVGKEAISVGRSTNANVNYNIVTGACRNHGDCGAIYLFSPGDHHPLSATVMNNNVKQVTGEIVRLGGNSPERYAIYLDDYANDVLVQGNSVQNNDSGMQIHNGYNNTIQGNTFGGNAQRDIMFSDSGYVAGDRMYNNYIYSNTFNGPEAAFSFYFNPNSGNQPPLKGVTTPAAVLDMSSNYVNTYKTTVISDTTTGIWPVPSTSPSPSPSPSPSATPTGPNWVKCASENGTCTFSGTHTVRFGTGTSWVTKVATGSIACNNATFGSDPARGYVKECDVDTASSPSPTPSPTPTSTTWVKCASENQICTFSGTKTVRYGAGFSWNTKVATSSIACNNSTFGDPAYGYAKECDIAQ